MRRRLDLAHVGEGPGELSGWIKIVWQVGGFEVFCGQRPAVGDIGDADLAAGRQGGGLAVEIMCSREDAGAPPQMGLF